MVSTCLVQASLGHNGCIYTTNLLQFKHAIWKQISASVYLIPANWPQVTVSALTACVPGFFRIKLNWKMYSWITSEEV